MNDLEDAKVRGEGEWRRGATPGDNSQLRGLQVRAQGWGQG